MKFKWGNRPISNGFMLGVASIFLSFIGFICFTVYLLSSSSLLDSGGGYKPLPKEKVRIIFVKPKDK